MDALCLAATPYVSHKNHAHKRNKKQQQNIKYKPLSNVSILSSSAYDLWT